MITIKFFGFKNIFKKDYPFVINPYNNNKIDTNILKSEDRSKYEHMITIYYLNMVDL